MRNNIYYILYIFIHICARNFNYWYIYILQIIHIDGAKAQKPKIPDFNKGTLPYELNIRGSTVMNNLEVCDLKTSTFSEKWTPILGKLEEYFVYIHTMYCK